MATAAGLDENEDLDGQSDSLTQDSDEIQEMYCEHCEKEIQTIVKADGFCVECLEYLCSTCLRYHKKYKPDHTIEDSANMPQDFCCQKCPNHTQEVIKFFCDSCDMSACLKCRDDNHKDCKVDHIPTLLKSTDLKKEIRQTNLLLDQASAELDNRCDNLKLKQNDVNLNRENARTSIMMKKDALKMVGRFAFQNDQESMAKRHEFQRRAHEKKKADLIAKLDKEMELLKFQQLFEAENSLAKKKNFLSELEKADYKLNQEAEGLKQMDELKVQSELIKVNKTKVDLTQVKNNLKERIRQRQNSNVFLAMKTAIYELNKLKPDIDAVQDIEINNYEFQPDAKPVSFTNAMSIIGSIVEKSKRRRKLSSLLSHPVTFKNDGTESKITGLLKLSDNCLMVADNANSSIEVIAITKEDISSSFQLTYKPFDITKVGDNEVAATIPETGRIQFLSVTPSTRLTAGHHLFVKKNCHGIVYKKPNFIVSFIPDKVQILEKKNGNILKTISNLNNPLYIALGANNNTLYIQESKCFFARLSASLVPQGVLTKISTDGKVFARQTTPKPQVAGFAVDKVGTIYVCSASGNNIIQISADLQTKYTLPLPPRHHIRNPTCSCYCDKENKLYVGTTDGTIGVFKID